MLIVTLISKSFSRPHRRVISTTGDATLDSSGSSLSRSWLCFGRRQGPTTAALTT